MQTSFSSERILEAFERVPRSSFVTTLTEGQFNWPVPIGSSGQQLSMRPSFSASMLYELELLPVHKVLEVGAGSGYITCKLSDLAVDGLITATELDENLYGEAQRNLQQFGRKNVELVHAKPGTIGHEDSAPYDRVLVCGRITVSQLQLLCRQLSPDEGKMIAPLDLGVKKPLLLGSPTFDLGAAMVTQVVRNGNDINFEELAVLDFTPID